MSRTKKKPLWCTTCRCQTPHVYVGKENPYEGVPLMRGVAFVVTFGLSETAWADKYWQCEKCGNIKTED